MGRGEEYFSLILCLLLFVVYSSAHTATAHKWDDVVPSLDQVGGVLYASECIDEQLRGDDLSSWCEFQTVDSSLTALFTWSGFSGNWYEVTGLKVGCSGTGSGWKNGVWAWNYKAASWTPLGSCGSDGENYWALSADYLNPTTRQAKLRCSAQGGGDGAGDIAELFVDSVYYTYNWFPTASPRLPFPLYSHSNVTLTTGFSDLDGDMEENSTILWFLNGERIAENVTEINTSLNIGDYIQVEYTPCDSFGQCGDTYLANATVENYPPTIVSITNLTKARGGASNVWFLTVEDFDDNQTLSISCYLDNSSSSICSGEGNSGGNLSFNCSSLLPNDTAIHNFTCMVTDSLNTTKIYDTFETDVTPPDVGWISVENYSNLTGDNPLIIVNSSDAYFMRFACSEESLSLANWTNFSQNYSGFRFSTAPGCETVDGWKTVFVEFMDDVGNVQFNHANATVFVDLTPPNTTDSYDGLIHLPGYNLTIYENDSHDSNITTFYCVDTNGSCTPNISVDDGENVTFTMRGDNYISYLSIDSVGNEQLVRKLVKINIIPTYEAHLQPENPNALTDLSCEAINVTNEEDQKISTSYRWFKNGILLEENSSILGAGSFGRGDVVTCEVVLNDGLESGDPVNTSIEIGNAPPQISLSIKETNSIVCDYFVTDPDNDELEVTQYWLKNDEYYSNKTVIHDEEMSPGDVFSCKVEASDGFTSASSRASYVVAYPPSTASFGGRGGGGGFSGHITVKEARTEGDDDTNDTISENNSIPENNISGDTAPMETLAIQSTDDNHSEFVPEPLPTQMKPEQINTTAPTKARENVKEDTSTGMLVGISVLPPTFVIVVLILIIGLSRMNLKKEPLNFSRISARWKMFPLNEEDQEQLVLEVARELQNKYGSFHGAGVYKVLEKIYGNQVSAKRIDTEKKINDILRRNPNIRFYERVGRKKLYRFE